MGLFRLPDVYTRLHATTKCDTLGAGSIILSLAILEVNYMNILKLLLITIFVLISSSTSGHALARSCFKRDIKPWSRYMEKIE